MMRRSIFLMVTLLLPQFMAFAQDSTGSGFRFGIRAAATSFLWPGNSRLTKGDDVADSRIGFFNDGPANGHVDGSRALLGLGAAMIVDTVQEWGLDLGYQEYSFCEDRYAYDPRPKIRVRSAGLRVTYHRAFRRDRTRSRLQTFASWGGAIALNDRSVSMDPVWSMRYLGMVSVSAHTSTVSMQCLIRSGVGIGRSRLAMTGHVSVVTYVTGHWVRTSSDPVNDELLSTDVQAFKGLLPFAPVFINDLTFTYTYLLR